MRTCLDCGARISGGSRCSSCFRFDPGAVYSSARYRTNRRIRMERAGGRCERILASGARCPELATEANHTIALATARTFEEALNLSDWQLLEAVCFDHNPRGA